MKKYLSFFKLRIICELQYRAAALAGLSTQFFFGFVYIMVYLAFFEGNAKVSMNLDQTITYLWLNQAFFYMIGIKRMDNELVGMVKDGNIAYELCRPFNIFIAWFTKIVARKFIGTLLRFWPVLTLAFIIPSPYTMSLPITITNFVLFLITLFLGFILCSTLTLMLHIITFYTMNEKGVLNIFVSISELFSGVIVPIPFMPKALVLIAYILPFRYINDLPFRLYNGNISINEGLISIGIQLFWILFNFILGYKLMNKALSKVVVQGG